MKAILTYFQESIEELRKVRWPTRKQAVRLSVITLIFVSVCAIAFGALDVLLSETVAAFLRTLF